MENINIGKSIVKYRKIKGYSIRELARLTNLTPSLLSQIERGLSNPSLQSLKIISQVLDVPTFYFFLEEIEPADLIVRANERKKILVHELTYELLSPDFSGEIETVLMRIPPHSRSSDVPMGHKGEEVAYIMLGTVCLVLEDETYHLNVGDSVKIPAFMKHQWLNQSEAEILVLFSVTPPVF
ncbi:helix-turn-helix domain-containing protein [Enterococcus pernyi]|uniref:helix-turn-helix domain-containing protein n=1 Tax=Enterococcus pernyi TaxID=590158 RepID=UPI000789BF35|nr:helix-turn-helix domain-containing protein [Enterococcus pernyi]